MSDVDIEALLVADLDGLADHVLAGVMPKGWSGSAIRITQIADLPSRNSSVAWLVRTYVQIDCYGTSRADARSKASAVRFALDALTGTHEGGVVTGVEHGSMRPLPDESFKPPRERFVVTAEVFSHP